MHVEIYLKDPYDTITVNYPPGWELQTQVFAFGTEKDPTQMAEYVAIKVRKADPEAY